MAKDEKQEGSVKFFDTFKNFGFISGDDGKDYFVHGPTGIKGYEKGILIKEGDRVSFNVVMGNKGPKAEGVEIVTKEKSKEEKSGKKETKE